MNSVFTSDFFNESSKCWMINKIKLSKGMFRYKYPKHIQCLYVHTNGKQCSKKPEILNLNPYSTMHNFLMFERKLSFDYCKQHRIRKIKY